MEIRKWVRKQLSIVSLSLSNVEKSALSQTNDGLGNNVTQSMRLNQGKISDSLINGEITQEVIDLRWRMYKILKASEGVTAEIIGYDEDGLPITKVKQTNNKKSLINVLVDGFDSEQLEMVIDNDEITISIEESMGHDNLSSNEYFAKNKTERPIKVIRSDAPNFEIETFTKHLKIRKGKGNKRLLEFYVSIYPDEYNRTSRLFINNIKKAIKNPLSNTMLDIKEVEFVTYKSLGVNDYLHFKYEIEEYDKIIEFNGFYVIKFKAIIKVDGVGIFEKYQQDELDNKYKNKEKK
jgi:hypothetical protein